MFVVPSIIGDWTYVQNVWNRWQSFNVGMLAFTSSLIAFSISKYNSEQQRKREFIASRAFLPEALSELTDYLELCAEVLIEAYPRAKDIDDQCDTPLKSKVPDLPPLYRRVFSDCIRHSEPDVAEYLSNILVLLQVNHSRLSTLCTEFKANTDVIQSSENIMSYVYCLGELQALINKTFEFARAKKEFDSEKLTIGNLNNAYLNLEILDTVDGLQAFTERMLSKKNA